jgi:MYXO-CTERM domain-containing protein
MNRIVSVAARTAAVVSLGVACALPAFAQSSTTTGGTNNGPTVETRRDANDDHRDFGWIGLLGLAGLLGLRRRHHHDDHIDTRRTGTVR